MDDASMTLSDGVRSALARQGPVVALESALITHGFAYPSSVEISRRMVRAIVAGDGCPATIGIWQGVPHVGLSDAQVEALALDDAAIKVSVRDLPLARVRGLHGGTTVAATAYLAARAGIRVFATGGIGGIHRGHPEDVSADLPVLASTPMVVVCAGAKSILDLPRTLEWLETWGVPVIGWRTEEFPAFYSRASGLPVDLVADGADDVVAIVRAQRSLGLRQAVLVAVPVPAEDEVPVAEVAPLIDLAVAEAEARGIVGRDLTPFILEHMVALSEARTQRANESLLVQNAHVAARIAVALAAG